ncbi:MAG: MFS transporter [Desulfobacteraceae bacterium IS3]|nr:MAG: MFS transporter [Desulfobacteraceae bacterium IS3]
MEKSDKKIFATLFFSIFTVVTGVGIVVPLLPVYAHNLGASGIYVGLIFGAFSFSRTLCLPYFGSRSDKKGRKPYIVTGLMGYSLISVAFMFSDTVESLIAIRFIQGAVSAMIMPVVQAYVGDITPANQEGSIMGFFNLSLFMGLSIGPLAGGLFKDHFGMSSAFLCMGLLALTGFFLSLFLLPPVKSERATRRKKNPTEWKKLLLCRDIVGLFFFRFAYASCISIIWSFLPIFTDAEFSFSSSQIGILVTLGILISGLIQTPMGFLADRISRKMMVTVGGIITVYAMFSFEWANGFRDLFFTNVVFGIGGGLSTASLAAMSVQKGSRSESMGSVMGLMTMGHSMGMMTGALLAGVTMDFFQLRRAFSFGSVIMAFGVILFFACMYRQKE